MNELERQAEADRAKNRQALQQAIKQAKQCSRCGGSWTLDKRRGICQHCGKPSEAKTAKATPRQLKSSRRRKRRQADNGDNGYDQLCDQQGWLPTTEGFEWATIHWTTFYDVASKYAHKAKAQDTQDLVHNIMEALGVAEHNNGHKPFTLGTLHRIAQRCVADYWREHYQLNNGLDCRWCDKAQRAKCRKPSVLGGAFLEHCHRAITLESLSKPIIDSEGNMTELGELIADPDSLDREFWDRESLWQLGYKPRLVEIALKLDRGEALTNRDKQYLHYYRQKNQKRLELS